VSYSSLKPLFIYLSTEIRALRYSGRSARPWLTEFQKTQDVINCFERASNPVKLAILDTGVDAKHPWINENWTKKWKKAPFYDFTSSAPYERTTPTDEVGHGTQMAGIILHIAQDVELYVIRVFRTREFEGSSGNDAMDQARKVRRSLPRLNSCV
jgi:subtilisin family serine protease